jgi:four helix bundle protein
MMDDEQLYVSKDENDLLFNEPNEFYDDRKDFVTLEAWGKCREVKLFFYKNILPLLPKEEKYNLDNQIRRAAISTTANISEGYGRYHYKEGIQFYRISRGSLYELKDHLISCYDLGYISNELNLEGEALIESAKRILNGYINFVRTKIQNEKN